MKHKNVGLVVSVLLASCPDLLQQSLNEIIEPTVINGKYPPTHPVAIELIRKSREKNARKGRKNPSHQYGN